MNKKLKCIMLVDDNPDDNFFHERVIRKNNMADTVIAKQSATDALIYLKSKMNNKDAPELILLDINMPGMNGWEFLQEYNKLDKQLQSRVIVVMLTTSDNPDDKLKAMDLKCTSDFKTKPLTKEMLEEIVNEHF